MFEGIIISKPYLFRLLQNPPMAMALFPFILLGEDEYRHHKTLLNHERIHLQQEIELGIVPFYVLYVANYYANLLIYKNKHQAYLNICFEREAYTNDTNLDYLKNRKFGAWYKYLFL
jgi:hypothetical protein